MGKDTKKGFLSGLTKFLGILLAVSCFVLALYTISAAHVKSGIEANLQPVVDELMAGSGADSVDVKIYANPGDYQMPWGERFHVFLSVNMKDLRRITDKEALEILTNGQEEASRSYSYNWEVREHAVYTRSVTDSVIGKNHPVFVTLSDGTRNYSLKMNISTDALLLHKKGAEAMLQPVSMSPMMVILVLITVVLALLMGILLYARVDKSKAAIEEEAKRIARNRQLNLDMDSILQNVDEDISAEKAARKKERQKKLLPVAAGIGAALVLAATLVFEFVITPGRQYEQAVALMNSGKTDSAYAMFEELGGFKDSEEKRAEIDYLRAGQYLAEGKPQKAYALLATLDGYGDSAQQMEQLVKDNPHYPIMLAAPGEIVTFGAYEQDGNATNGKEPIEWIVLYNEEGETYLLSRFILDARPYNTGNTYNCSLNEWLKTAFHDNAFESVDTGIIARVGLLPEGDIDNYKLDREYITTDYTRYALDQNPHKGYASGLTWWLLDASLSSSDGDVNASVVWEDGSHGAYVSGVTNSCGVRPAIWLFADPEDLPSEPEYSGHAPDRPKKYSSKSSSKCSSCNGTGKKLVTFYSEGNWGSTSYSSYTCTKCNGTGRS